MSEYTVGELTVECEGRQVVLKVEAGPASTEIRVNVEDVAGLIVRLQQAVYYEE